VSAAEAAAALALGDDPEAAGAFARLLREDASAAAAQLRPLLELTVDEAGPALRLSAVDAEVEAIKKLPIEERREQLQALRRRRRDQAFAAALADRRAALAAAAAERQARVDTIHRTEVEERARSDAARAAERARRAALDERREANRAARHEEREKAATKAIIDRADAHTHAGKDAEHTRAFASRSWLAGLQRRRWKAQQEELHAHRLDPIRESNVNTKERRYLAWEQKYYARIRAEREAAAAVAPPAPKARGVIRHVPFFVEAGPPVDIDELNAIAELDRSRVLEEKIVFIAGAQGKPKPPLIPVVLSERMQEETEVEKRRIANLRAKEEQHKEESEKKRAKAEEARQQREQAEKERRDQLRAYREEMRRQRSENFDWEAAKKKASPGFADD